MGTAKAGYRLVSGRTIFDHVYTCLEEIWLPCVAVGHADGIVTDHYPDLHVIPDERLERGPVGALYGLFRSNVAQHYLVVGCDQPLLTADLLRTLLVEIDEKPNVFCREADCSISPLPGLYPASLLPAVEQLLEQPRASLRELLTRSNARRIAIGQANWLRLRSANTPQDVEDINEILR